MWIVYRNKSNLLNVTHSITIAIMSKNIPIILAVLVCAAILYPAAAQSTSNIGGVFDYDKAKDVAPDTYQGFEKWNGLL